VKATAGDAYTECAPNPGLVFSLGVVPAVPAVLVQEEPAPAAKKISDPVEINELARTNGLWAKHLNGRVGLYVKVVSADDVFYKERTANHHMANMHIKQRAGSKWMLKVRKSDVPKTAGTGDVLKIDSAVWEALPSCTIVNRSVIDSDLVCDWYTRRIKAAVSQGSILDDITYLKPKGEHERLVGCDPGLCVVLKHNQRCTYAGCNKLIAAGTRVKLAQLDQAHGSNMTCSHACGSAKKHEHAIAGKVKRELVESHNVDATGIEWESTTCRFATRSQNMVVAFVKGAAERAKECSKECSKEEAAAIARGQTEHIIDAFLGKWVE